MSSAGELAQQPPRVTPFRSLGSVLRPRSQALANSPCRLHNARKGTKLFALPERSAVNAATLETTETDLSAELKDVLSKVQPKVIFWSLCKIICIILNSHKCFKQARHDRESFKLAVCISQAKRPHCHLS